MNLSIRPRRKFEGFFVPGGVVINRSATGFDNETLDMSRNEKARLEAGLFVFFLSCRKSFLSLDQSRKHHVMVRAE
jgi:hypothetical protein